MRKTFKTFLLLAGAFVLFLNGAEIDLSAVRIKAANKKHEEAAAELKKHLALAGAKFTAAKPTLEIFVGRRGAADALQPGEGRTLLKGKTLYIWGDDTNRRNGTAFAVYTWLEKKLGAKWLFPGDEGIVIRKTGKITVEENESLSYVPPLKWGYVRGYGSKEAVAMNVYAPAELRRSEAVENQLAEDVRLFLRRQRQGRVAKPGYGHAFIKWADKYWKKHPEYFGMDQNGKRVLPADRTRAKLCLVNPDVIEAIVAEWVQSGKGATVNICPNDGTPGYCRCPGCMKLDTRKAGEDFYAHLTDRYLNFWNRFVERARKERPDVMAITYVYSYYRHPPRREKIRYPDNLLCGLVPLLGEDSKELFAAWQKAGMKNSFLRPNDLCYRSQILRFMEKRIYDKFQSTRQAFKLHGADYDAGAWVPALDLESYTAVRMIAFPEESFEKIQADFCSGFGKAAEVVSAFYNNMRPAGEKMYNQWFRNRHNKTLDDSRIQGSGNRHYQETLRKELAKLKKFPEETLSPAERKRFRRLRLTAEHSLLVSCFMDEGALRAAGKKNSLAEAAEKLWNFRMGPGKELPLNWGKAFGMDEKRFWEMTSLYHKFVLKDELNTDDPEAGWINSFDDGLMQNWRQRKGFEKLSPRGDIPGKFCVESKKLPAEEYVISKHLVPLTPGAHYKVSFEVKSAGASTFRLRVRHNNKDLCAIRVNPKENQWQSFSKEFTLPADVKSVIIYCSVKAPKGGFIDNIRLTRIKK